LLFIYFLYFPLSIKGFSSFQYKGIKNRRRKRERNDKTDIRLETTPGKPGSPFWLDRLRASGGAAMKVFPAWMYRDPATVAERIENTELRARARIRELVQEQELGRMQQSTLEQMALVLKRVIFAPPEIRMKRARIQALARAAMKERK